MSQIDRITVDPFQPISAPELPDLANNLYAAYLRANNLTTSQPAVEVGKFFSKVTAQAKSVTIYDDALELDARIGQSGTSTVHHVNSFFHLTSVAQELRRQMVRRQLENNMWTELAARRKGDVSSDEPLKEGQYVPGGFAEWLFPRIDRNGKKRDALFQTAEQFVSTLGKIVSEYILTQHPTNSNPVALNRSTAELVAAALEVTLPSGNLSAKEANRRFAASMVRLGKTDRVPNGNFSVTDEISLSNNSSANFLHGRTKSFLELYKLATIKFGYEFTPDLQLGFAKAFRVLQGDWSASDDDGNDNIKAEHRLSKLATQRLGMARLYQEEYTRLAEQGFAFARERAAQMGRIAVNMASITKEISGKRNNGDIILSINAFEDYSRRIGMACETVTGQSFASYAKEIQAEAEAHFKLEADAAAAPALLGMINSLQNSGMYGYHNELRKNCDFNREALSEIIKFIPEFRNVNIYDKDFGENSRLQVLNHLIMSPQSLQHAAEQVIQKASTIIQTDRDYSNPLVKAYHTIQSLRLTQSHSDCYQNFVLAETKQSCDMLTAMALQVAGQSAKLNAKPHWLNIIPLFEDADTLLHYPVVVAKAVATPGYQMLLVNLGEQEGLPRAPFGRRLSNMFGQTIAQARQQIMFAHSDSWRLAGRMAADGLLAIARLSKWGLAQLEGLPVSWSGKLATLVIEKFHGLSLSDPSRSGGIDQIGMIDDEYAARRPKKTVQGVDQANHLNSPVSAARLITKDLTKAVKVILGDKGNPDIEREMMVANAAKDTADSYVAEHFMGTMPKWLSHPFWNYEIHNSIANFSSRLSARKKSKNNSWVRVPPAPNLDGSRAISVSNAYWYSNTVNTYFAARHYVANLARAVMGSPTFVRAMPEGSSPVMPDGINISVAAAQELFGTSKEYTRNVDKATQGIALTDLPLNAHRQEYGETRGIPKVALTQEQTAQRYDEYMAAGRLGSITFKGEELGTDIQSLTLGAVAKVHEKIQHHVLPAEDRNYLSRLVAMPLAIHDRILADTIIKMEDKGEREPPPDVMQQLRLLDATMNRVRGPRLDINDVAESAAIRKSQRTPSPVFADCILA